MKCNSLWCVCRFAVSNSQQAFFTSDMNLCSRQNICLAMVLLAIDAVAACLRMSPYMPLWFATHPPQYRRDIFKCLHSILLETSNRKCNSVCLNAMRDDAVHFPCKDRALGDIIDLRLWNVPHYSDRIRERKAHADGQRVAWEWLTSYRKWPALGIHTDWDCTRAINYNYVLLALRFTTSLC